MVSTRISSLPEAIVNDSRGNILGRPGTQQSSAKDSLWTPGSYELGASELTELSCFVHKYKLATDTKTFGILNYLKNPCLVI
jgi:hypothetical protein